MITVSEKERGDLFVPDDPSEIGLGDSDSNSTSDAVNTESAKPGEYSEEERDSAQAPRTSHSDEDEEYLRQSQQPLATELPDTFSKSTVDPAVGFRNYGLSSLEAMFLRTVIDAFNGHNEYPLELPMSKHLIDNGVDAGRLEEEGFIKQHYLLNKGHYYTPTTKAQTAVARTLKAGNRIGDVGEDMPHRVLTILAQRYFESLRNVHLVKLYAPIGSGEKEGIIDVLAVDEDHNPLHVAEIEAGERNEDGRWGTNNGASVAKDYKQMSSVSGQKWWFVRNRDVGKRILNHLKNRDLLPLSSVHKGPLKQNRHQLQQIGDSLNGIDHIYSANELHDALENKEPLTDE